MHNLDKKHPYIEDGFDLEDFKKRAQSLKQKNIAFRKYKKKAKLLYALCAAMLFFAMLSAGKVTAYYMSAKKNAAISEKAREIANAPSPSLTIEPGTKTGDRISTSENDNDIEERSLPIITENHAAFEKVDHLRKVFSNDDIIGYLQLDGTNIDYAVAQASDNDFYLNHDLYREKNAAGSIFMDYECDTQNLSLNTVIYGHNMRDGSMFHNLRYFSEPEYLAEHRYISLTTPYDETVWEIFSFYETGTDFYYIQVNFPDIDLFLALVAEMKSRSLYNTGIEAGVGDKILTLSTCANSADDTRLVINAKLLRTD